MLHHVNYDTRRRMYCGPTALCAVTGMSASVVLSAVAAHRSTWGYATHRANGVVRGVRGMFADELVDVLLLLGFKPEFVRYSWDHAPTVAQFCKHHATGSPTIVAVRKHFVSVSGDGKLFCDTNTKQPVSVIGAPYMRSRVKATIAVQT